MLFQGKNTRSETTMILPHFRISYANCTWVSDCVVKILTDKGENRSRYNMAIIGYLR